jgi:hypothetical protein
MFAHDLHALMGESLWPVFAWKYALCARGNGFQVGYLPHFLGFVRQLVSWYHAHRVEVDALVDSHLLLLKTEYETSPDDFQNELHYHLSMWVEFKDIFVESNLEDQKELMTLITCKQNIYQTWSEKFE